MKLYRYVRFSRLLSCISSNTNTLLHPTCWKDPFESVMLSVRTVREKGLYFNEPENRWQSWPPDGPGPFKTLSVISGPFSCGSHIYCQCWTRKPESDAMWNMYSKDDDRAARITVERDAFLDHTKGMLGERDYALLEDVTYAAEEQVIESCHAFAKRFAVNLLKRPVGERRWFEAICELMRLKRRAYDYELETRLMVVAWEQMVSKNWDPEGVPKTFTYTLPVNELIEEIVLHPSLSDVQVDGAVRQITEAGYGRPIRQSDLYAPRNFDHRM